MANLKPTPPAEKKRGSNKMPKRTRYIGRDAQAIKRFMHRVWTLKKRDLTTEERGAAASLCNPFVRESRQ